MTENSENKEATLIVVPPKEGSIIVTTSISIPSISSIQTVQDFKQVFNIVLKEKGFGARKIGHNELNLLYRSKLSDTIDRLREIIRSSPNEESCELWDMCKVGLQYELVLPEDHRLDLEMYRKMQVDGEFISRAFLNSNSYPMPKESPYSKINSEHGLEVVEHLMELLISSPLDISKEIIEEMNDKMLYLFCRAELYHHHQFYPKIRSFNTNDYDQEAFTPDGDENIVADEAQISIEADAPPLEETMPLSFWIWENLPDRYKEIMIEVLNVDYDEVRNQFYEVLNRTQPWKDADSMDETVSEKIEKWLKK